MPIVLGPLPFELLVNSVEYDRLEEMPVEGFIPFVHFVPFMFSQFERKSTGLFSTPMIPDNVYGNLPPILKYGSSVFTKRERDVWLTSALVVVSGIYPMVRGKYRYEELYPNLFCFIVAPQASGKGVMKFARELGVKVDDEKRRRYKKELFLYISDKENKKGKKPVPKVLFIPGDITASQLIKILQANNGEGLLCESEADTIVAALQSKWGNFSDKLRNVFDNSALSFTRATDQEYVYIELPKLAMAITGTPDQLPRLISSSHNGLLTRNIFYIFESDEEFDSIAPKNSGQIKTIFHELACEVYEIYKYIENTDLVFQLSDEQMQAIDKFFKEAEEFISQEISDKLKGFVKRMAVITFKTAMVLSVLRQNFEGDILRCSNTDVNIALQLANVYLQHSTAVYLHAFKGNTSELSRTQSRVLEKLPVNITFNRAEAITFCESLGKCDTIIDRTLKILTSKNYLEKLDQGIYKKIKN